MSKLDKRISTLRLTSSAHKALEDLTKTRQAQSNSGITMQDLVREAIDLYLETQSEKFYQGELGKDILMQLKSNQEHIAEVVAFIQYLKHSSSESL